MGPGQRPGTTRTSRKEGTRWSQPKGGAPLHSGRQCLGLGTLHPSRAPTSRACLLGAHDRRGGSRAMQEPWAAPRVPAAGTRLPGDPRGQRWGREGRCAEESHTINHTIRFTIDGSAERRQTVSAEGLSGPICVRHLHERGSYGSRRARKGFIVTAQTP